jgi:hypothetical protein
MSINPFDVIDKRLRNIEFILQEVVATNQPAPAVVPAPAVESAPVQE